MIIARLLRVVMALAITSGAQVHAQSDRLSQHGRSVVVVSSSAGDERFGLVDEAVSFWNMTFREIGVCYSLGPVTRLVQPVPEEALLSFRQLLDVSRVRTKFRRFSSISPGT